MATPNSAFTQALSTAIDDYSEMLHDNVLNNIALLSRLKRRGNVRLFSGGPRILENVRYNETTSGWYSGSEIQSVEDTDTVTTAQFDFKQFYANVTMSGREEIENAGPNRKHDLIAAKLQSAEDTTMNSVGASLFFSNTENNGKSIGGLQHLVADSPASGTVGGINAGDFAFWRNFVFDFSSNGLTAGTSTILTALNTGCLNTERGNEYVDLIVAGTTYFQYFEGAMQAKQYFTGTDEAQSGFKSYKYKGADVVHDPNCSSTRMYGLNTKYVFFRPYRGRNFTQGDRKDSINQDVFVKPMYFAGNMTIGSRERHFVIIS